MNFNSPKSLRVRLHGRQGFEGMASVLAALAYPLSQSARTRFERAVIFQFARDIAKDRPGWGRTFAILADDLPTGDVDQIALAGYDILDNERQLAGDIALGYSVRAQGKTPVLQGGKFGVNKVMQVATEQGGFRSASTGYKYWTSSYQVAHLAVAFKLARQRCASDSIHELLELPDGAATLVDTATYVKGLLLSLQGPKNGPTAIPDFASFGMIDIQAC